MTKEIVDRLRNVVPGYHPGWGGPEYTSWQDEQMSWKTTCCLGDWSFLPDMTVEGPDALRLFRDTSINGFERFDLGQAKHIVQCNSQGKVIAEGVLMRLGEEKFSTQSTTAFYSAFKLSKGGYRASWRQTQTFQFQVAGPNALALAEKVSGESLRDIGFMRFRPVTIAGRPVNALRQGMSGEVGFELHGAAEDGSAVYEALVTAGEAYGLRRLGHRTAMINHLEAAFPTGNWHYLADWYSPEVIGLGEFVPTAFKPGLSIPRQKRMVAALCGSFEGSDVSHYFRSPVELGWAKSIRFDHDFPGRAALETELADLRRVRVTLAFDSEDVIDIYASLFRDGTPYDFMDLPHQTRWVTWADKVLKDGRIVGVSTVPGYSAYFRKILALAYIEPALSAPGSEVVVIWGNPGTPQKPIRAIVGPAPYKKDNRRSGLAS